MFSSPEKNALVLSRSSHMVIGIVGELKDVRGELGDLVFSL